MNSPGLRPPIRGRQRRPLAARRRYPSQHGPARPGRRVAGAGENDGAAAGHRPSSTRQRCARRWPKRSGCRNNSTSSQRLRGSEAAGRVRPRLAAGCCLRLRRRRPPARRGAAGGRTRAGEALPALPAGPAVRSIRPRPRPPRWPGGLVPRLPPQGAHSAPAAAQWPDARADARGLGAGVRRPHRRGGTEPNFRHGEAIVAYWSMRMRLPPGSAPRQLGRQPLSAAAAKRGTDNRKRTP